MLYTDLNKDKEDNKAIGSFVSRQIITADKKENHPIANNVRLPVRCVILLSVNMSRLRNMGTQ